MRKALIWIWATITFLAWDLNTDTDMKWYRIYRLKNYAQGWKAVWTVSYLTNEITLQYFGTGFYAVTAVDQSGNESPMSNQKAIQSMSWR